MQDLIYLQVRSVMIVMMNITFNLNVAARFFFVARIIRITFFRFFIVAYAHDFVKNGQFEIRLFHQIYWLAWMDRAGKIATFFQPERKLPPCTQFQQIFHFQKSVKIILGRVVHTPNLGNEGSFYLESLLLNTTQKYVLK